MPPGVVPAVVPVVLLVLFTGLLWLLGLDVRPRAAPLRHGSQPASHGSDRRIAARAARSAITASYA